MSKLNKKTVEYYDWYDIADAVDSEYPDWSDEVEGGKELGSEVGIVPFCFYEKHEDGSKLKEIFPHLFENGKANFYAYWGGC